MQQKPFVSTKNRILARLPHEDVALLKSELVSVELPLRLALEEPGTARA
jgi:hypothetical protein